MSAAADRAKELRTQLKAAEAAVKAERDAERAARRERERQQAVADTDVFREENYEAYAGPHSDYVTVSTGFNGGIEVGIAEWTNHQTSASLTREEALALAAAIQKLLK